MLSQEIDSFIVLWDTDILNICVKLNGFIGPYQIWLRNGSIISSPPPPPSCWDPHCSWRSPLHSVGLGCNWEDRMWDDPLQGDGIIVDSRYSPLFLSSAILSPFRSKLVRSSARVAARGYPLLHLGDLPLQPGGQRQGGEDVRGGGAMLWLSGGQEVPPGGRWLETEEDDITKHLLVKDLDIDYFDIDRIILILCRL